MILWIIVGIAVLGSLFTFILFLVTIIRESEIREAKGWRKVWMATAAIALAIIALFLYGYVSVNF